MHLKENVEKDFLTPNFPPRSSSLPPSPTFPLFLPLSFFLDSCHSLHTMDQDYYEGTDCLSPVAADGDRTEEFEYEVRNAPGITTYYRLAYKLT